MHAIQHILAIYLLRLNTPSAVVPKLPSVTGVQAAPNAFVGFSRVNYPGKLLFTPYRAQPRLVSFALERFPALHFCFYLHRYIVSQFGPHPNAALLVVFFTPCGVIQ